MAERKYIIFRSFTFLLLYTIFSAAGAQAQDLCEKELAKAEQAYSDGFFEEVITLISACLNKGDLTSAELALAYKLLGQAHISKNDLRQARIHAQKLLEVAPDYEPDRDQDLQLWIDVVKEAKKEREAQMQRQPPPKPPDDKPVAPAEPTSTSKGGSKKWLWIGGGGAVLAGTAAYFIFKGDEARQRLPDPPGPPPR